MPTQDTFTVGQATYKITHFGASTTDGKKHPLIIILHGNFGLRKPYGDQILSLAKSIAALGYAASVPQYYADDFPHLTDSEPERHVPTLAEAIKSTLGRPDVDPGRLGLVGFSLGAGIAMSSVASKAVQNVKVFVDFYGPLPTNIQSGIVNFPPTAIFHNKLDQIVPFEESRKLFNLLPDTVEQQAIGYVESRDPFNHAFDENGFAFQDSQNKAREWLMKYLPSNGS